MILRETGDMPLPEPMMTKMHDVMWCLVAMMGKEEF